MNFTVIIPTFERSLLLQRCLDSLYIQTKKPVDILIVDNGDDYDTMQTVLDNLDRFNKRNIKLQYIMNSENSVSSAKNLGATIANGDVVSFLDDDCTLDEHHYEELDRLYSMNPDASGIAGLHNHTDHMDTINNLFRRFFCLSRTGTDEGCKVLTSFETTFPSVGQHEYCCEWLHGGASYLKTVFQEIGCDNQLKKYSYDDDIDLSYRIHKKYPCTLFLCPAAKIYHAYEGERQHPAEKIFMKHVYSTYLFYKNIEQTWMNKLLYLWSRIGYLLLMIGLFFKKKARRIDVICLLTCYLYCLQHLKELKNGELGFFNEELE